jgi:hypothetical protein
MIVVASWSFIGSGFQTTGEAWLAASAAARAGKHHLGHKSASITLDRYGHLFPEELDHLADRLDRLHAQAGVHPACTDSTVAALGQGKGPWSATRPL